MNFSAVAGSTESASRERFDLWYSCGSGGKSLRKVVDAYVLVAGAAEAVLLGSSAKSSFPGADR